MCDVLRVRVYGGGPLSHSGIDFIFYLVPTSSPGSGIVERKRHFTHALFFIKNRIFRFPYFPTVRIYRTVIHVHESHHKVRIGPLLETCHR